MAVRSEKDCVAFVITVSSIDRILQTGDIAIGNGKHCGGQLVRNQECRGNPEHHEELAANSPHHGQLLLIAQKEVAAVPINVPDLA